MSRTSQSIHSLFIGRTLQSQLVASMCGLLETRSKLFSRLVTPPQWCPSGAVACPVPQHDVLCLASLISGCGSFRASSAVRNCATVQVSSSAHQISCEGVEVDPKYNVPDSPSRLGECICSILCTRLPCLMRTLYF